MWRKEKPSLHCWQEGKLTGIATMENKMEILKKKKKKLGIKLLYDPAISLLDMHLEEARTERDTCAPTFIAALFTITKTGK